MASDFSSGGEAFAYDASANALFRIRREPRPLSAAQGALLSVFLANPGRQLSVAEIEAHVWDGRAPEGAVHHAVRALMRALGDDPDAPIFIEALSQRGYRFIGGVEDRGDDVQADGARAVLDLLGDAASLPLPPGLSGALAEAERLGRQHGASESYLGAAETLRRAAADGERMPPIALETVMDGLSAWA